MQEIDSIIEANIGLIYRQLNRLNLANNPDALSLGYEALWNAIIHFDESKGVKLSTVASVYIYNALGSYLRTLNRKKQLVVISYNAIIDADGHEVGDILPSEANTEGTYIRTEMLAATRKAFDEMYDKLTNEKHKQILGAWDKSDFKASTIDLSKQTNVSQSYVSQVINNFKSRLKKKLEEAYYD